MATLVLLRNGESAWNAADVFTGWIDVRRWSVLRRPAAGGPTPRRVAVLRVPGTFVSLVAGRSSLLHLGRAAWTRGKDPDYSATGGGTGEHLVRGGISGSGRGRMRGAAGGQGRHPPLLADPQHV